LVPLGTHSSYPTVKNEDVEGAIVAFVDITERRHAEEKLRKSEERFKAQYKGFPLPTYSWRKVGEDFRSQPLDHVAYEFTQGPGWGNGASRFVESRY